MTTWTRYPSLGRIYQLRNEGRELIGEEIWWTLKRDGSNIVIRWDNDLKAYRIGSHNKEDAEDSLADAVKQTPQYSEVLLMLNDERCQWHKDWVLYAEYIPKGHGPTRIEGPRDTSELVVIDLYDNDARRFCPYEALYQKCSHFNVPVVPCWAITRHSTVDDVKKHRDEMLARCTAEKWEGVVGKAYASEFQVFFKEKIDLPKLERVPKPQTEPTLPVMPDDVVYRAVEQALGELEARGESVRDPKVAMPVVVVHVQTQAREHDYSVPRNIYSYYQKHVETRGSKA